LPAAARTVAGSPCQERPRPASCPTGLSVLSTSATPSPVAPGGTETIRTQVCSGTAASDLIVDLEIYDAAGQKVAQSAIGGQSFAAGEARDYTWAYPVPSALPAGTYRVTVGIFSGDWATLYLWENQAGTFVVQ
jgi:hypothetical protein